jgi:hypothetical protein
MVYSMGVDNLASITIDRIGCAISIHIACFIMPIGDIVF